MTRRTARLATPVLALAALAFLAANLLLGSYTVTPADFVRIVVGHFTGQTIPGASFIIMETRLPQSLTAVGAGAAFGMSGWLFQTLLRNPLASPDVIGISYGASAAAVAVIVLGGAWGWAVPHAAVSAAALVGALAVAALISVIARRRAAPGAGADSRLVLVGIGIAAGLQALIGFLLTRTDVRFAQEALAWLNGSLNAADWDRVGVLVAALAVLMPAALAAGAPLAILALGDDLAAGLGLPPARARGVVVLLGVALAAVATAATGPISFVAFLAAPIAHRLGGRGPGIAALVGATIVLAAAFVSGTILPALLGGVSLPVGVVTGAVGAPVLVWLLVAVNRKET
ncbi:MAG: iron ABC transporter permease [Sinomonas sp.]|nr:iron ABC transporter permease [Sinomonas sp.]